MRSALFSLGNGKRQNDTVLEYSRRWPVDSTYTYYCMAIAKVDRSVEQKPRFSVPFGVEGKLILPSLAHRNPHSLAFPFSFPWERVCWSSWDDQRTFQEALFPWRSIARHWGQRCGEAVVSEDLWKQKQLSLVTAEEITAGGSKWGAGSKTS
jgi:hypothetical protein